MKLWYVLYVKELRDNRSMFLFLLGATLVFDLYSYFNCTSDGRPSLSGALALIPFVDVFVFPFILLHSFAQEFKGQTHYQLLALPVPRAAVVAAKFLAVLTAGGALFVLAMGAVHLVSLDYTILTRGFSAYRASDLWLFAGQFYFTSLLLLMGIATAMAGLKLLIKRFQGLAMTAFLVASLYLYGQVLRVAVLGPIFIIMGDMGRAGHLSSLLPVTFFSVLFSLLFVGLGILLFERFAEA
ncbi:MAG: ABC transporter permease [Candidatus Latescibacteria bacterium]|nr:ABC transporter permease [Candidatus Latescibacterota bacterium]